MESLAEYELGYAAATIDCDGYIRIALHKSGRMGIQVGVETTDSILTNWLADVFGGGTYQRDRGGNRRPTHSWLAGGLEALDFLYTILPYMKLKWEQAELALKAGELMHRTRQKIGEEDLAKRVAIKEAMSILNRRGRQ